MVLQNLPGILLEKIKKLRKKGSAPSLHLSQRIGKLKERAVKMCRALKEVRHTLYLHGRRVLMECHEKVAGRRLIGPAFFLGMSMVLATALTFVTLYTTSYAVYVDGKNVGVVADRSTVEDAVAAVEQRSSRMLGYEYTVDNDVTYRFAVSLRADLDDGAVFEDYLAEHLDDLDDNMRQYEIFIDGQSQGAIGNKAEFNAMLQELKDVFTTESTIDVGFVEEVQVVPVLTDNVLSIEEMRECLTQNTTGETTYEVVKGDTFNSIAYRNDMSVSDLKLLNPDVNINMLSIGQLLNVKEIIPRLSIHTTERVAYHEAIPCPLETVEDNTIYVGSSKIITQGEEGEALVTADVTMVNGVEKERDVLNSITLQEPTKTVKAIGTKERPKTASTGKYKWPCSGKITSYFGYRNIFGSTSYHSGIDIACNYGTPIKAADGGKVTFSGTKSGYGNLIIITHDNGQQTYYGHCSSLLVSAGTKVYQGQVIAKVGSTGRSTGNHCHFEVRTRGSAVNPLNYLR